MTGFAGLAGSRLIYQTPALQERLLKRYAPQFFSALEVDGAAVSEDAGKDVSAETGQPRDAESGKAQEAVRVFLDLQQTAAEAGHLIEAGEGGVYAALWQLLKQNRCGAVYAQRAIPILQETIEICETFDLNPYRLYAKGCAVWLVETGGAVCAAAEAVGLPAAVIGYQASGAAIRRRDCPEDAFLRRPEPDALARLGLMCR